MLHYMCISNIVCYCNLLQQNKYTVICLFEDYCSRIWLQVDYWMCTNTSGKPVAFILSRLKTFIYIYHTTWCHTLEDSSTIYITTTTTMKIQILHMFALFLHLFPSNCHYTISQPRFWTFFIEYDILPLCPIMIHVGDDTEARPNILKTFPENSNLTILCNTS